MKSSKRFSALFLMAIVVSLSACTKGPVKTVQDEIYAIGTVKESSLAAIETARADYERLTDEEKIKVSNYQTLLDAEYDYDKILAQRIDDMIDNIDMIDDSIPDKVSDIKKKYDELTKEQQRLVNKLDKLDDLLDKYNVFQVEKIAELIEGIKTKETEIVEDDFLEIDNRYAQLSDEQKELLDEKLGQPYQEAMQTVQVVRCQYYIDQIDYIEGVPSKQELKRMIVAAEIYDGMSDSSKKSVVNIKKYDDAIKAFSKFVKERAKTDKLFARRQYISECDEIVVEDICAYASSYKGHLIKVNVKFITETSSIAHTYNCIVDGTEDEIEVKDDRNVKEPVIVEGDVLTIYGEITGTKNVKVKEENSGLFNTNLFAKTSEEYIVPVIKFLYSDNDNLGIIKSGDPNDKDTEEDVELEDLINTLKEYIK